MDPDVARRMDELARHQHGVVTSRQAIDLLGEHRKDYWTRTGRLIRVQPSVFRLAGAPLTWHQELMAAQLSSRGVISHRSSAELWGVIQPAGHVEVSVWPPRKPRLRPPACAHRVLDLRADLAVERDGLLVTDPVRTLVDLGLVAPAWVVDRALAQALSSRLVSVQMVVHLREALGRRGRNGTGVIGELVERRLLTAETEESVLEARFVDLLHRHDLPLPEFQYEVWDAGRFVARVDAAYPPLRLAIEVDGYSAHVAPDAFQRDRTRQNDLVALGWTVLRFTWADVVRGPTGVAGTVRAALRRLAP